MHHFRLELTPFPCVIFDHYISGIGIKDLQLILDTTPSGKHAVIIMDQASWHQTYLEDQFDNLLIMHLPPCSPELNPVVNVWSWLCQNEIANRYFKTYNDIMDKCCVAWNRFCDEPKRLISLCYRD